MRIDRSLEEQIAAAKSDATVCLVLEWPRDQAIRATQAYESRKEKRTALARAMELVKEPLISKLRSEPAVDVNDLSGSGHAVVAASAAQWLELLASPMFRDADVRILPNETFDAHDER